MVLREVVCVCVCASTGRVSTNGDGLLWETPMCAERASVGVCRWRCNVGT